ncbi:MAG: nitrate/nitrite transporter [Halobacteriaceae archaeon]
MRATVGTLRGDGRGWVLLVVSLGWFSTLGFFFTIPAMVPFVKETFEVSNATVGLAITALWVFYGAFQLPAGYLTDRTGERLTMAASLVVGTVSLVALASAPQFFLLVAACALFGAGAGLFATPRVTSLQATYPENDGTALGIVLALGSVAGAAVPFAAGRFAANADWRLAFLFGVPVFLAVAVGTWRFVPSHTRETTAAEGEAGSLLVSLATMFRKPAVRRSAAAATCTFFVFEGLLAFLTTYLVTSKGLDAATAATYYGLFFVAAAVAQPVGGNVADFVGHRRVLVGVTALYAVTLAAMPLASGRLVIGAVVLLLGVQRGSTPVMNAYVAAVLPEEVKGTGYGLLRTTFMGVAALGPVVAGALADAASFGVVFYLLAAVAAVGTLLYAILPPREQ